MKMLKRVFALLLALVLVAGILPLTVSAEAGDWDPTYPRGRVAGSHDPELDMVTYRSQTFEAGSTGYLKNMPVLSTPYYSYNAMAYCGAEATSSNPDIVKVVGHSIGKWNGGDWNGADCLQLTVNCKKAGTVTITEHFYFTYSQSANPFTNPNAVWGYATTQWTITVTGTVEPDVTYTLNYDANGGTGAPAPQTATNNMGYAQFQVSSTVPTKEGFNFLGWADDANATEAVYQGGASIRLEENAPSKTLYAVWAQIPEYTYTLTYDANGGEGGPGTDTVTTTEATHTFTVPDTVPTKAGYVFKGWADMADATTAGYEIGAPVTVTKDAPTKTIYAVWEKEQVTYTLNYEANGGSGAPDAQTATNNMGYAEFQVSSVIPTREGFNFLGWADDANAAEAVYQGGASIRLEENAPSKTLYAVWAQIPEYTYTLTYDANGGEGGPGTDTVTTTETSHTFTVSSTAPAKEGYNFLGWAEIATATEATIQGGNEITLTKDEPTKTIYAVWEEIPAPEYTYTLTYAPNGEGVTGMPEAQSETTTAESYDFTVANETPAREGYTFLGWADEAAAATATYVAGATVTVTKDAPGKTLYAVWEKNHVKNSEPGMKKAASVASLGRGQEVLFTLTSNVPDYLGDYLSLPQVPDPEIVTTNTVAERGKYDLKIHDEMDSGLTYQDGTLAVTVNSVVLTEEQYEKTITKNDDGTTSFLISMNLVRLCEEGVFTVQEIEDTPEIKVTYTATLDVTAGAGKYRNEAWTTYPAPIQTRAAEGEKDSEHSIVELDVYGIRVFKYDQSGNTPLEGAEFRLLASDRTTVLLENVPSGKDGYLMFDGLAAGTYYVEETKAPAGYVKSDVALPVTLPGNADLTINISDAQFANARIPHTGGEGTTRYVILGSVLMGMAVALYLASHKKRSFQA